MQGVGTTWPGLIGAVARTTVVAGTVQSAPAADDSVEQLKEVAALKDQGILTHEDFAAKKRQILGI